MSDPKKIQNLDESVNNAGVLKSKISRVCRSVDKGSFMRPNVAKSEEKPRKKK